MKSRNGSFDKGDGGGTASCRSEYMLRLLCSRVWSDVRHCQVETENFLLPKNNTVDVTVLQITLSLSSIAALFLFSFGGLYRERLRIRPIETEQGQSLFDFCVTFDSTLQRNEKSRVRDHACFLL